jgi:FtsP/CotA-like multicopper oxidase with cupredoxin domain
MDHTSLWRRRIATLNRRQFLATAAGLTLAPLLASGWTSAAAAREFHLTLRLNRVRLVPEPHPLTEAWTYNGAVPGPEIRVRQGERVRVVVENRLDEETTIHWHGVRTPNAMDGVPHLTQPPIAARGGRFVYDFVAPDAGTYWYHPHQRSHEQVGRGLYGAFIVEERNPIAVDRDETWVLDDWRLSSSASIREDFGDFMDVSHGGRIGNTVTINGRVPERFAVRSGERIRLRLINAANARIFGLEFRGHRPQVIALDGQPVEPHEPEGGRVVLGPGMRADLVIDMPGRPGEHGEVHDTFYRRNAYQLVDIAYTKVEPLREQPLEAPMRLPDNPLAEPDLKNAERREIAFEGGMMGRSMMGGRGMGMGGMMGRGVAWAVNGVPATEHVPQPLFVLERGKTYILSLANDTAWHHPIHLHGHAFRVISRNGEPTRHREWLDTVLLAPDERAEIAFVADNPGHWMIHCHILEHAAGGMMAVLRVA